MNSEWLLNPSSMQQAAEEVRGLPGHGVLVTMDCAGGCPATLANVPDFYGG